MRRRLLVVAAAGGLMIASLAAALLLWPRPTVPTGCQVVFPTSNRPSSFDVASLRAQNRHLPADVPLDGAQVNALYKSDDPRNFAVDVTVADFSRAFGLPATDAQNPFYGRDARYRLDPGRRVVLVFSYGDFDWRIYGGLAAQAAPSGGLHWPYHLAMGALDAQTGSLIVEQTPVCK